MSKQIRPVYRATTLLIVDAQGTGDSAYTGLLASDQLVSTYMSLIAQPVVLKKAVDQVGGVSVQQLQQRIHVSDQPGTQILQLQVDDTDPGRAAQLANAVADAFVAVQQNAADADYLSAQQNLQQKLADVSTQISSLSQQIAALQAKDPSDPQIQALQQQLDGAVRNRDALEALNAQLAAQHLALADSVRVFQPASSPTAPDHPRPVLNAEIAGALGFFIAGSLVFLIELLDDRVRTSEQFEKLIGAPMLAAIRVQKQGDLLLSSPKAKHNRRLIASFRSMEANLSFVGLDEPIRTIVVTSALPGEGKTMTAVNLAVFLSQNGKRVLLVDADMRKPQVHDVLHIPNTGGLSLWLLQSRSPSPVSSVSGMPNLYVLTAGPKPPNPSQLLGSARMEELFQRATGGMPGPGKVDVVVVDTPPVGAFVDAAVVSGFADAVIFVGDGPRLRAGPLLRAQDALMRANARIVGVVLNRAANHQVREQENYDYYRGYLNRPPSQNAADDLAFINNGNAEPVSAEQVGMPPHQGED